MSLRHAVLCFTFFSLGVFSSHALVLRSYDASKHLRFLNFPSNPSHNSQFIHAAYDLTGVGWHSIFSPRQLTMVSPLHFVGANHYKPGLGATIRFLSSDGNIHNFTVASQTAITNDSGQSSDLFIGTLNTPIPAGNNINYYPYLNLSFDLQYYFKQLIVLGATGRGGEGSIQSIQNSSVSGLNTTRVLRFRYTAASGDDADCYFESGDSGSPVFVEQNGAPAIVGTNSYVASFLSGNRDNYSNFIPYYVDKLNTVMELDGYRMTKATTGSTSLTLTHTLPSSTIRAGHSFDILLAMENTGNNMAENIRLTNTFPAGTNITNSSNTPWFDQPFVSDSVISSRKASIDSDSNSSYSITLTIPDAGSHSHSVVFSSDQSTSTTQNYTINVIESFISWADDLTDKSSSGDDDRDGIINLLEYAFGGDPETSSQFIEGETTHLLPQYSENGGVHTISYVRRKDYVQRALSYNLTSSTNLTSGSFTDASTLISDTDTASVNDDLELVTYTLTKSGTERFFRIEVTLNE